MQAEPTRVLVVDDHPVVRDGVVLALSAAPDLEVVGSAGSAREAVEEARRLRPHVLLIDLHMPGGSGTVAIRELARVMPDVRALVLTMDDDDESLFAAMRAGARGYLLKGAGRAELERGVRAAAAGEMVFGPAMAARVASLFDAPRRPAGAAAFPDLSDRELAMLGLLAAGKDNAAIGAALGLAPKTVRNQLSLLLVRVGAPDRAAAIATARAAGLGRDPR